MDSSSIFESSVRSPSYTEDRIAEIRVDISRTRFISNLYMGLGGLIIIVGILGIYLTYQGFSDDVGITSPRLFITISLYGIVTGISLIVVGLFQRTRNIERESLVKSLEARKTYMEDDSQPKKQYFDRLVDINVINLGEYYSLVKSQTNKSFQTTLIVSIVGFVLLALGLVIGFTASPSKVYIGLIASASGIVVEFIAAIFFYLYNQTVRQLKGYHDSLLIVQNVLLAFKLVDDMKNQNEKADMMMKMLAYLMKQEEIISKVSPQP